MPGAASPPRSHVAFAMPAERGCQLTCYMRGSARARASTRSGCVEAASPSPDDDGTEQRARWGPPRFLSFLLPQRAEGGGRRRNAREPGSDVKAAASTLRSGNAALGRCA